MYKNAGLAYLNLVRSPRQPGVGKEDVLVTPHDPLGAAPLLPWKTEAFVAEADDHHQVVHEGRFSVNGDEDGHHCPALYGGKAGHRGGERRGRGGEMGATSPLHTGASMGAEPSEASTLTRSNSHGSSGSIGSGSKAMGNWRSEASTRFMHMWKQFLDHEDAPLDSQYGTVRDIYEKLVGHLGAGPKADSRDM